MLPTRYEFRAHPLDGAMLYFHPATGTHVRVETEATRRFTRQAPRVVMFGITNACNLRCAFCSRDVTRASGWTVDSAASVLEGLAAAGTLEVAFGGGEPFAFRELDELLLRLRRTTRLALHVTTNGTFLNDDVLARLSGVLGQVRVSIYPDVPWRPAAQALARHGQTWGANVLVHDGALAGLPSLLADLAALGARDVSLLSYVGPDATLSLGARGEETLAAIISASPLPCRVSVCFGARLRVPRLWSGTDGGGDCGAGIDFLGVTPDRRVQSCSFQDESLAIETAEDALVAWRTRRDLLRRASPRAGCARARPRAGRTGLAGLRVWQSFSGNNSGECVLVAKFESTGDAEELLAELIPGYVPGEPYSAPWKELFERERIPHDGSESRAPEEMIAVGRSFIARTGYTPGDDFPELRALSWKRGGEVIAGGVHEHDGATLAVVRARDAADAAGLAETALEAGAVALAHGPRVILALSKKALPEDEVKAETAPVAWRRDVLKAIAGDRPLAMELVFEGVDHAALTAATKRLGAPAAERPRLVLSFWDQQERKSAERARALAAGIEGAVTQTHNLVLVDDIVRKHRVAIRGHREGASVTSLDGEIVVVHARLWREVSAPTKGRKAPDPVPLDAVVMEAELRARLRHELGPKTFDLEECVPESWSGRVRVRIRTSSPSDVLRALAGHADSNGLEVRLWVFDIDPLQRRIRRLLRDVDEAERVRPRVGG